MPTNIQIKNMVCPRCVDSVREILLGLNLPYNAIVLGSVELVDVLDEEKKQHLNEKLSARGFELLDDKKAQLVNQIKSLIIKEIHYSKQENKENFSTLLTREIRQDYSAISKLFSTVEGMTIEKYILAQKVERIKELISYDELNFTEIAHLMNYSSAAHLSAQFKKVTGLSPTEFKKLNKPNRKFLDDL